MMSSGRMAMSMSNGGVIVNFYKTSGKWYLNGGCWPVQAAGSVPVDARVSTRIRTMANGTASSRVLTIDNVNPNLKRMEYAVRGPLLIRALEIEKELQKVRL